MQFLVYPHANIWFGFLSLGHLLKRKLKGLIKCWENFGNFIPHIAELMILMRALGMLERTLSLGPLSFTLFCLYYPYFCLFFWLRLFDENKAPTSLEKKNFKKAPPLDGHDFDNLVEIILTLISKNSTAICSIFLSFFHEQCIYWCMCLSTLQPYQQTFINLMKPVPITLSEPIKHRELQILIIWYCSSLLISILSCSPPPNSSLYGDSKQRIPFSLSLYIYNGCEACCFCFWLITLEFWLW